MKATQNLPENYHLIDRLYLLKNPKVLIWLNVAGLVLLLFSAWLFSVLLARIRPEEVGSLFFSINGIWGYFKVVGVLLAVYAAMIIFHEGIHGLFFWLFSRAFPVFGFRIYYAFASAPGWYFPRNPYLLISLAPLLLLDALGVFLLAVVPASWLFPVVLLLIINTSGAVGDIFVACWLLKFPSDSLALDLEDGVQLFHD